MNSPCAPATLPKFELDMHSIRENPLTRSDDDSLLHLSSAGSSSSGGLLDECVVNSADSQSGNSVYKSVSVDMLPDSGSPGSGSSSSRRRTKSAARKALPLVHTHQPENRRLSSSGEFLKRKSSSMEAVGAGEGFAGASLQPTLSMCLATSMDQSTGLGALQFGSTMLCAPSSSAYGLMESDNAMSIIASAASAEQQQRNSTSVRSMASEAGFDGAGHRKGSSSTDGSEHEVIISELNISMSELMMSAGRS